MEIIQRYGRFLCKKWSGNVPGKRGLILGTHQHPIAKILIHQVLMIKRDLPQPLRCRPSLSMKIHIFNALEIEPDTRTVLH